MKVSRLYPLGMAAMLCAPTALAQTPRTRTTKKAPKQQPAPQPEVKQPEVPVEPPPPAREPEPVVEAPPPTAPVAQVEEVPPVEPRRDSRRFILSLGGGVAIPNSVFRVGPVTTLSAELQLAEAVPLKVRAGVGFESHAGTAARTFLPPNGGYDGHALDNQLLVPIELGVVAVPWKSGDNALTVGAAYGALVVMSHTSWLGLSHTERGLGHQFALEAGFAHLFGQLELSLKARYALRRTVVGVATSTIELPWYQLGGVTLGVGWAL